jgi:hypothetical protein
MSEVALDPKETLNHIVNRISEAMAFLHTFEDSRPGQISLERLEEGLMWAQVVAHNIPLKPFIQPAEEPKKDENIPSE